MGKFENCNFLTTPIRNSFLLLILFFSLTSCAPNFSESPSKKEINFLIEYFTGKTFEQLPNGFSQMYEGSIPAGTLNSRYSETFAVKIEKDTNDFGSVVNFVPIGIVDSVYFVDKKNIETGAKFGGNPDKLIFNFKRKEFEPKKLFEKYQMKIKRLIAEIKRRIEKKREKNPKNKN